MKAPGLILAAAALSACNGRTGTAMALAVSPNASMPPYALDTGITAPIYDYAAVIRDAVWVQAPDFDQAVLLPPGTLIGSAHRDAHTGVMKSLLILDDDARIRQMLDQAPHRLAVAISEASSGAIAMHKLRDYSRPPKIGPCPATTLTDRNPFALNLKPELSCDTPWSQ